MKRTGKFSLFMGAFVGIAFLTCEEQANAATLSSASTSKILLTVNGSPITELDLAQRIRLVNINSGGNVQLSDSQSAEILESLIQERLQIKIARDKKITVAESEIEEAFNNMAKENKMTTAQLIDFLKGNGVSKETMLHRIRAQLHWMRYIRQQYAPVIHVSDNEVERNIKSFDAQKGQKEYLLSEIALYTTGSGQEDRIKRNAEDLVRQIRQGAKFEALARELSKSDSASKGGDMGWHAISRLDPTIADKITSLKTGQVSDPIRVSGGYKIIMLKGIRHAGQASDDEMEISLIQAVFPLTPQSTEEELNIIGPKIEETMATKGCAAFKKMASSHEAQVQESQSLRLGQLPDQLKDMIKKNPVGKSLQPIMTPDGLIVTMVCQKKKAEPVIITTDHVRDNLEQEKYGARAARELQRLKSTACIECKDPKVLKMLKL